MYFGQPKGLTICYYPKQKPRLLFYCNSKCTDFFLCSKVGVIVSVTVSGDQFVQVIGTLDFSMKHGYAVQIQL